MKTVRSFDVFDTCLTRRVAVPSGVFYEVARKVFDRLGIPATRAIVEDFVAARIEAERLVRRQTQREDVTLQEIWAWLARSMGWQPDETLSACELAAEEQSLVPVAELCREVQAARRAGHRIVFVSDMYLPPDFIERQLNQHGFAEPGDGIYVSGAIGKTKSTGNLFRHVLQQENVSAANFLHAGDNPHGDFAVPRQLGIEARLCDPARMTQTEISILQTDGDARSAAIAGAMRAFRLAGKSGDKDAVHQLAAQLVGPFVMGFAVWVLQRAQESGVKRLYFLSRDCQLVSKVARELAAGFGGIDCQYLQVSRQALFLPSADAISPAGMPWMQRDWEEPVLKKLLAKLELTYESVADSLGKMAGNQGESYCLKSPEDWACFWQALNAEPIKTRINELIVTRRKHTRQYFESSGMFDGVPWAIVDLGWTLSCQQALWRLLKQWGWPGKIRGFYFGLVKQRAGPEAAGVTEALFYQPAADVPKATNVGAVFDRITLLEHIIGCADHPTVHHHDKLEGGKAGAVYAGSVSPTTLQFCRELHEQTLAFARQNRELVEAFREPAVCQKALATLVPSFFTFPTEQPVSALRGMFATGDQNGLNALPIVEPLNWKQALLPLLPQSRSSAQKWRQTDTFWREGSLAITPPQVRRVSSLAQRAANRLGRLRSRVWPR